jgi:hypothetical protein
MKKYTINTFIAALAAIIAVPAGAATLEQTLTFQLSGNAAGTTYTNHDVQVTPDVQTRIATKDIIALVAAADGETNSLRSAQLLILSEFGPGTVETNEVPTLETNTVATVVTNSGIVTTNFTVTVSTNREATQVVIRDIKGRTNDLDVTRFFRFETLTNAPVTKTGRVNTASAADLGSERFELACIVIQNGTNAPLLSIQGYKTVTLTPHTDSVKINHKSVSGLLCSWDLDDATGVGRSELGVISVFGGASANVAGVTP